MADTAPYHDRDGFIWYDGKLVPWREANLHVLSHALHYAQRRVRGRARLRRRDLRADPAQPAPLRRRQDAGFHHPLQRGRDRPGLPRRHQGQQAHRLLRAPDRLARQRDDGRLRAVDQDPPRRRRLGLGLLLPHGAAAQGHPADHRQISPARSGHRAGQDQGRRPLHDLHASRSTAPSAWAMPTP